ncbi:hypothetical protein C8F04DRAFT_1195806 [Mycena alexandri]|uniref:Uncharacterized protein n=1 Tax=Mycena alexandri TaxID=1745969 RepID=A0AAD6S4L7_9AGAR|nr:hypothetical protein C8F04DRAFT_1195806 [Mycena alexandri]
MADWENPGQRKTRSGTEYSPFANAIALRLPDVRLARLLERRDDGPDSDTDSLDESDNDLEPPAPPREPAPCATPTLPPPPGYLHSCCTPRSPARNPPPQWLDAGLCHPRRPPSSATQEGLQRRDQGAPSPQEARQGSRQSLEREVLRAKASSRLKGITRQRVRQAPAALQLDISIDDLAAPVATSGWQGVRQEEPDAAHYDLEEMRRRRPDMRVFDWDGTPTPVIDADRNILLVLGGSPPNDLSWGPDVANDTAARMEEVAIEIYTEPKWRRKASVAANTPRQRVPRREARRCGNGRWGSAFRRVYTAIWMKCLVRNVGKFATCCQCYVGGVEGSTEHPVQMQMQMSFQNSELTGRLSVKLDREMVPKNLLNVQLQTFMEGHSVCNLAVFAGLFGLKSLQRLAGWTNFLNIYTNTGEKQVLFMVFAPDLHEYYPRHLRRPLRLGSSSNRARSTSGETSPSAFLSSPPQPTTLGRSPSPSRTSTLVTSAWEGIFRWVYNDFRTDKDINASKTTTPEQHQRRKRDRESRWREGIKMYRKWDGPVQRIANLLRYSEHVTNQTPQTILGHRTLAAKVGQSAFLPLTYSIPPAIPNTSSSTFGHILLWVSGQHSSTSSCSLPPFGVAGRSHEEETLSCAAFGLTWATRNKAELQRKACERMAKRRAQLKESGESWAAYTEKVREESARYRQKHAEDLALNQATIAKRGFAAWHEGYLKRHPRPLPVQEEDLPEWPSDSEGNDPKPAIPPPPPPTPPATRNASIIDAATDFFFACSRHCVVVAT